MPDSAQQALSQTNFSSADWLTVAVYLLLSLAIGLMVRKYALSMTNYVTAGRKVGTWLGVATMTGTELGLVTVMYSAEKGYKGGFAAFHIAVIAGLVTFFVGLTGFIVAPLRERGVLTIPEFYEQRFGRPVRILGGTLLAVGGILNMALFLKVGSIFLVGITGLSQTGWALPTVMTVLLLLVLVYTILGGMISVVLTDYIQFVVLSFGMLVATGLAIHHLGWDTIFATVESRMGENGFNPLSGESAFGVEYVLWMAVLGLVGCAIWPTAVARALAMESSRAVKRQFMWSSVSFMVRFLIPYFWGICAFVFIVTQAPDLQELFPITLEEMNASEGDKPMSALYAMPIFLGRILPVGIIGLISAAMIAAFMSTHDSYLLCWSSVLTQDVIAPLWERPLTARARVRLTRVVILLLGIYVWCWGIFYQGGDDIWDYMAITGAIYFTGAFPLLVGGLYWKRASSTGALWALIAGCFALFGLEPVRTTLDSGLRELTGTSQEILSGARVGLGSVAFTTIAFVAGSLLFPDASFSHQEGQP